MNWWAAFERLMIVLCLPIIVLGAFRLVGFLTSNWRELALLYGASAALVGAGWWILAGLKKPKVG